MLNNVLEGYLDGVKEREFDAPLLLLLSAIGFTDIHFLHGPVEFGKDIIAKKVVDGNEIQYSFQSKVGNISQREWRNEIRGQIETALLTRLAHPNFDPDLPHQVVLVTTGDLRHNAALELQDLNDRIKSQYSLRPVEVWSKRHLLELLLQYGLDAVHVSSSDDVKHLGQFFMIYAKAIEGTVTIREIEEFSRSWFTVGDNIDRRILLAAVESEVLTQECMKLNLVFESVQLHLALLRLLIENAYETGGRDLGELWDETITRVHEICFGHISAIKTAWIGEKDLVKTWAGDIHINTYPVLCSRIVELASIAYFSAPTAERRDQCAAFLAEFVQAEPGCARPISDRYAVSVVLGTLALLDSGDSETAATLVEDVTSWLATKFEDGSGLAGIEADETEETSLLLGSMFSFMPSQAPAGSFLATALVDLVAFIGDPEVFSNVVNDVKAVKVHPEYWQPADSVGAVRIDGTDVVRYPSVLFADSLPEDGTPYGDHWEAEQSSFRFVDMYGKIAPVVAMALLRDRYFPKLFPLIAPGHVAREGN